MPQRAPEFDSGWVGAGPEDDLDRRLAEEDDAWDAADPRVVTVLGPVHPAALGPVLAAEPLAALAGSENSGDDAGWHALLAESEDAFASGIHAIVAEPDRGGKDDAAGVLIWLAGRTPLHIVRLLSARPCDETLSLPPGFGGLAVSADDTAAVASAARRAAREACPLRIVAADSVPAAQATEAALTAGVGRDRLSVSGPGWVDRSGDAEAVLSLGAAVVAPAAMADITDVADFIAALVARGFGDRVLIAAGLSRPAQLLANGGNQGLGWVMERLPLAMMAAGLGATTVRAILVDNPARVLTIGPAA